MIAEKEFKTVTRVALDTKNRVSLTKVLNHIKKIAGSHLDSLTFKLMWNEAGEILLVPEVSVPVTELWLYKNPQALASVVTGLQQAAAGEVQYLGNFAQYADEAEESDATTPVHNRSGEPTRSTDEGPGAR